jgi:CBS domain-containing protein
VDFLGNSSIRVINKRGNPPEHRKMKPRQQSWPRLADSPAPCLLIERRMKFMPCTVDPSDSVAHARALLEERHINHLPVLSEGHLVGIVSTRDLEPPRSSAKHCTIARALELHPDRVVVASVMTTAVYTAKPKDTLTDAAMLMLRRHVGALPIVEQGQLRGMLDRGDIVDSVPVMRRRARTRTKAKPNPGLRLAPMES